MIKILMTDMFFFETVKRSARIIPLFEDELMYLLSTNNVYFFFPNTPIRSYLNKFLGEELNEDDYNAEVEIDIDGIPTFLGERFEKIISVGWYKDSLTFLLIDFS